MSAPIQRGEAPLTHWQRYRATRREREAQAKREEFEAAGQLALDLAPRAQPAPEAWFNPEVIACFD